MARNAGRGALGLRVTTQLTQRQQEKRYRSMQEHIRRAHPDYYIPKLPATEESFQLMISTPPSQRPQQPSQPTAVAPARRGPSDASDHTPLLEQPATLTGQPPATANAAVALAQLHNWDSDFDVFPDSDYRRDTSGLELPSLRAQFHEDTLPPFQPSRTRELLPSILQSPSGRYSSLPPIQRRDKLQRPRKPSMGQNARKGKHERGKSREFSAKEFSRRLSVEGRKAMSAEPPTAAWVQGKRWEDLIEAATSATEADDDRDLTPMPQSPNFPPSASTTAASTHPTTATTGRRLSAADSVTASGGANKRSSLPPGFRPFGHHLQPQHGQYNASPLQRTLTPPPPDSLGPNEPEPFPSVESLESAGSGQNFHISGSGLPTSASSNDNTSPLQHHSHPYQHSQSSSFGSKSEVLEIYCASCGRPWLLKNAFACTECICGVCSDCVGQIISSPVVTVQPGYAPMRRGCPRCGVMGGKWKRFQLDFR
ncbi:uncharacterized protein Z518_03765 [Rhinocladiella mackenziei CBS 650.93]|uniref:RING zinc finger-like domain-containing protein n=1 Tax=Rhinocladiella mackenziei CBS 650.93 TaxID=1442369 RepID=A0A0D2H5V8_9EURO|nr:uncharacterized protein Z518_03765 [Rhinocladiella mackenziei CBS 650.93]KIX05793.1 hypothetical protein Z518_03765 [Rhinocladiella mackenziei CBS 650.93]